MIGIILAAGNGTRLKTSRNNNACKPLTEINNTPLIMYSLENLRKMKIDQAWIVVGKEGELIKQAIGNTYKDLSLCYIPQFEQKGLIHALMCALTALEADAPVVLQLSDEIFVNIQTENILRSIHSGNYDFLCGITLEEDPEKIKSNYSVELDRNNIIMHCTEKPVVVTNNIKGTGFCYFSTVAVQFLKLRYNSESNQPRDLCDYMNMLIQENQKGLALQIAEKEFNINTSADFIEAQQALAFMSQTE